MHRLTITSTCIAECNAVTPRTARAAARISPSVAMSRDVGAVGVVLAQLALSLIHADSSHLPRAPMVAAPMAEVMWS